MLLKPSDTGSPNSSRPWPAYVSQIDGGKNPVTLNSNVKAQAAFFQGIKDLLSRTEEALGFKESDNILIDFAHPYLWEQMLYAKTSYDIPEMHSYLKEVREYKVDDLGKVNKREEIQLTQELLSEMFTDGNKRIVTEYFKY